MAVGTVKALADGDGLIQGRQRRAWFRDMARAARMEQPVEHGLELLAVAAFRWLADDALPGVGRRHAAFDGDGANALEGGPGDVALADVAQRGQAGDIAPGRPGGPDRGAEALADLDRQRPAARLVHAAQTSERGLRRRIAWPGDGEGEQAQSPGRFGGGQLQSEDGG
jgi:hypothetical protein